MFGIFSRKKAEGESLVAPASGRLVALQDVPDPVFSGGIMGPGFAVDLGDDTVCSPVDGEIVLLAETLHAFAVRSGGGAEVLVHVGIDTVKLGGEGFTPLRAVGERVQAGDPVIQVDRTALKGKVPSLLTPVMVVNAAEFVAFEPLLTARPGETVVSLVRA